MLAQRNLAGAHELLVPPGTGLGRPALGLEVDPLALAGLGTSACAPSLLRMAGRAAPARLAGAAVGTVTTLGYLGFVVGPAAVGGVAGATTLPTAFGLVAGAAALLAAGSARLLREGPSVGFPGADVL